MTHEYNDIDRKFIHTYTYICTYKATFSLRANITNFYSCQKS